MNVLFVGAHHDDLEVSCGGTVRRWVDDGHKVFRAILTDSTWAGQDGNCFRGQDDVERYCQRSSEILGYRQISLKYSRCFELTYSDDKVVDLLNVIGEHAIDTLVSICLQDAHKDYRAASEIGLTATRRVPRVLVARVSWNTTPQPFGVNYFVEIT